MQVSRTGVILNVENYDQCIEFYKDIFDLKILFEEQQGEFRLCCFDFAGAYLMIETGGSANPAGKPISEGAAKLRFNVKDLNETVDYLITKGIDATIRNFDWGSTINIFDPDGNRLGITEESRFAQQFE